MSVMKCLVCDNNCISLFKSIVLNKYLVQYYQCTQCNFIQTEPPFWLSEAYQSTMTKLDIGAIRRNIQMAAKTENLIYKYFDTSKHFIDYGGGYGMFVRMMRDKGFNFFRQDLYCTNLFAEYFDISDTNPNTHFELLTAFEIFEHLENPKNEIEKMLALSNNIFFSTTLQPHANLTPQNWWYFIPETGQHIALYSTKSLQHLAASFNCFFYSDGKEHHLFTKNPLPQDPFVIITPPKKTYIKRILERVIKPKARQYPLPLKSLVDQDFEMIKTKIVK